MCEIRNALPEPTNHFRILKRDLPASPPEGKLIGFMHRHPPGFLYPSENDLNGIPRGFVGLVWCEQSVHWYDSHGLLIPVDLYGYFNQ
jgi:proteasome lid subunit RPN8/RPN11